MIMKRIPYSDEHAEWMNQRCHKENLLAYHILGG